MNTPTLPIRPAATAHVAEATRVTQDINRYLLFLEQRVLELEKHAQQTKRADHK